MTKEEKFYKAVQDVFIGAKIEGEGGFINMMQIKAGYYSQIEKLLKEDIDKAVEKYPSFREELFDKLYSFFSRYFTESGSIYFNSTPFHSNTYEKVYTDKKDVILFWKTQMLYYVKTDRIFKSMPIEFDGLKFYFDASQIENKRANEKRSLIYQIKQVREDETMVLIVKYSERGSKTKTDEMLKSLKKKNITINEELLEKAFRVFEKQSEVDFFINKNVKAFLQEQFKLWSYQYFWDGAKEWYGDRVNQLQILKNIAFKIIDFVSQFEDELVKIWNKPKFVRKSNYVITLDRIGDKSLVDKILEHKGIADQINEWKEIGIVDSEFNIKSISENKKYKYLPIDTKYFKDLELEIIALFEDLDNQLDGWLIKSENYQALHTILPKFKERVQTIYIDPPFNTGDDFDYIDNFQDSTWLTLMENRLVLAHNILHQNGSIYLHLDENANYIGRTLMDYVFGDDNFKREIIWDIQVLSGYKVKGADKNWILGHQSIYFYTKTEKYYFEKLIQPQSLKYLESFNKIDEKGLKYQVAHGRRIYKNVVEAKGKPYGDVWSLLKDVVNVERPFMEVWNELTSVVDLNKSFSSVWSDIMSFQQQPTSSERLDFDTQKPEKLLERIIKASTHTESRDIVLDYYGGSGTSANVSQILGKKWICIEMGKQFDEKILPRLKKTLSGFETSVSRDNKYIGSGIFKYYSLEQYEEALANCKYRDGDLFSKASENAYQDYVFMKDEKMLSALDIDYEKNNVNIDLSKLYTDIDIAETLSNLTGKWIKAIKNDKVEFTDGSNININILDYKLIKSLIWW
ncbi:MAG: site-specific DNA-methyltransferase [Proteobacteria bacterium]|nr:site-specific DNA-methyltransferase [Pseudomonadota bacterium]